MTFSLSGYLEAKSSKSSMIIKPFSTDYCTGYHEGTRQRPGIWKHCCLEHDLYFWAGGSREDRKEADLRLGKCVEATGEVEQARLMYAAVSLGAYSPIRLRGKHFGNAWQNGRSSYTSLTAPEILLILQDIDIRGAWVPLALRESFRRQLWSRLETK